MSCTLEKLEAQKPTIQAVPYCVDQPQYFGRDSAREALVVEVENLRAENSRLTIALEAISGTIAIYRAHQT